MRTVRKIPDVILVVIFYALFVINLLQVIFRYVFNASLVWSEELLRSMLVWCTFLGTALCIRDGESIIIDVVSLIKGRDRLVRNLENIQRLFTAIIVSVFMVLSYGYLESAIKRNLISPAMQMPLWVPISSLFISSVLSLLYLFSQFHHDFFKKKAPNIDKQEVAE